MEGDERVYGYFSLIKHLLKIYSVNLNWKIKLEKCFPFHLVWQVNIVLVCFISVLTFIQIFNFNIQKYCTEIFCTEISSNIFLLLFVAGPHSPLVFNSVVARIGLFNDNWRGFKSLNVHIWNCLSTINWGLQIELIRNLDELLNK